MLFVLMTNLSAMSGLPGAGYNLADQIMKYQQTNQNFSQTGRIFPAFWTCEISQPEGLLSNNIEIFDITIHETLLQIFEIS